MHHVTQLVHDHIVDAAFGRADELGVKQDAPVAATTTPTLLHPAQSEAARVVDPEGGDVLAAPLEAFAEHLLDELTTKLMTIAKIA